MILNVNNKTLCKVLNCITSNAFKYLCNIATTDYELPVDDAIASKHVEAA